MRKIRKGKEGREKGWTDRKEVESEGRKEVWRKEGRRERRKRGKERELMDA
jgi:hypothetical protein